MAIIETRLSSIQPSLKKRSIANLVNSYDLTLLVQLLSSHGFRMYTRSCLRSHSSVETMITKNRRPRPSMKFDVSYPASSKFSLIGSGSALKENKLLIKSSGLMMSKFVKCMISSIILLQFCGMFPANRTVNTLICKVLIRPQRY